MHSGRMGTEGYVDRGSDPAGALCELPPKSDAAFNFSPDVRVHRLPRR